VQWEGYGIATNQPAERTFECGYGLPANAVAVTPDGTWIVTAGSDTRVRVWNMNGGLERTLEGHNERLRAVIVTPDGARIVSAGDETKIQVWNLATGELEDTRNFATNERWTALAATPDSAGFVAINQSGAAWFLGFPSGWKVVRQADPWSDMHRKNVVAVTPDGTRVVLGGTRIPVEVRNLATGELERTLDSKVGATAVAVTPDGARIIVGDETSVRVWNLATGELERTIESRANAVAVTPDGARIMVGAGDIEVWTLATGELERTLESHGVSALAVSRDGARVVSVGSQEGIARIWRL
jgi:WD40 repeat protein